MDHVANAQRSTRLESQGRDRQMAIIVGHD
jgi:hypothetical protein